MVLEDLKKKIDLLVKDVIGDDLVGTVSIAWCVGLIQAVRRRQ